MRFRMKSLIPILLFFTMLLRPQAVFDGASKGLMLWFEVVLPTLYPFLLLSSFLLATGNLSLISSSFGGLCSRLLHVSEDGSFAVLTGFLCGYPMGAKTAADLYESGYISHEEGRYLLSFCNNTSPSFILNFLVLKTLGDKALLVPTILILTTAPLFISLFTRRLYHMGDRNRQKNTPHQKNVYRESRLRKRNTTPADWTFREIDICIMDSFETLLKVGGYIILFSVIISLLQTLNTSTWFGCILSCFEVTNGLVMLGSLPLPEVISYPLMLGLTAFGGLCAAAQTQCMIQRSGFPIWPYIMQKLAAALTASILGFLYMTLLHV